MKNKAEQPRLVLKGLCVLCLLTLLSHSLHAQAFQHKEIVGGSYDGSFILDIEEADFNGDGLMDFAVAKHNPVISWFRNLGNGQFEEVIIVNSSRYYVYTQLDFITVKDMNRDGTPDIVGSYSSTGGGLAYIMVLANDGDGNFTFQPITGAYTESETIIEDFNRDGYQDIVVCGANFQLKLHTQDANGNFTETNIPDTLRSNYSERNLVSGDFNNDGIIDFAVAGGGTGALVIHANNGNAVFTRHVLFASNGDDFFDIATLDIEKDGDLDLVAGYEYPKQIKLFRNDGNFVFNNYFSFTEDGATVQAVDMDQDGFKDILTGSGWYENNSTWTRHGIKAGNDSVSNYSIDITQSIYALNLDADASLEVVHSRENNFGIFDLQGGSNYNYRPLYRAGNFDLMSDVSYTDMDNDSLRDIVFVAGGTAVGALKSLGGMAYDTVIIDSSAAVFTFFVGDIDMDGDADIVTTGSKQPVVNHYMGPVIVYENLGGWNFNKIAVANTNYFVSQLLDFDFDGDKDLLILEQGSPYEYVTWYEFQPGYNFIRHIIDSASAPFNDYYFVAQAHDFNKDSLTDVIVGTADAVRHYRNTGAGFNRSTLFANNIANWIVIADFNGDTWTDFAINNPYDPPTELKIYRNTSGSGFSASNFTSPLYVAEIMPGDIDNDNDLDLVFTTNIGPLASDVSFRKNDNGTFSTPRTSFSSYSNQDGVWGMDLFDYDADGDLDWLCASYNVDGIMWLENLTNCAAASIQLLSADVDSVCSGTEVEVTIRGNLGNHYNWNIYSDSCAGTLLYKSMGTRDSTWSLTVDSTTTIYVSGGGGCATQASCQPLTITVVQDTAGPQLVCKADTTVVPNLGSCTYTILDSIFQPTYSATCGIQSILNNVTNNAVLIGTIIQDSLVVTWTAEDVAGLQSSCTQTIRVAVTDTEAPSINCHSDTTVAANFQNCSYKVLQQTTFQPTFSDNCSIKQLTNSINSTASLLNYVINDSVVASWTVEDVHGLQSSCTQTIHVISGIEIEETILPATDTSNGSIEITVDGAVAPNTYLWSTSTVPNFSTQEDLQSVPAGEYHLSFTDAIGCADSMLFIVPNDSSTSIATLTNTIKIHPNPGFDNITVSGLSGAPAHLSIIDLNGRQVVEIPNYQGEPISISHLLAAHYFVLITDRDKVYKEKLVVR